MIAGGAGLLDAAIQIARMATIKMITVQMAAT